MSENSRGFKRKIKTAVIAGAAAVIIGAGTAAAGFVPGNLKASETADKRIWTAAAADTEAGTADTAAAAELLSADLQTTDTETLIKMLDVSDVIEQAVKSVVAVNCIEYQSYNTGYYGFFYGQQGTKEVASCGTGIIIGRQEDRLLILTNNHVVEDADVLSVAFVDGEEAEGSVLGTAPDSDIALVAVQLDNIKEDTLKSIDIAVMGDSDELRVGNAAIAIGNALGYGQSVTTGVISALNREVKLVDMTLELIQTDAAINEGNSGGPLLNAAGEVIGINSAKYSADGVEGMGYAIPVNTAKPIIEEILNPAEKPVDTEQKAYLGIYGISITAQYQFMYGMPAGAYVYEVEADSPAQKAGLSSGDIITAVDDTAITSMEELSEALAAYKPGDEVTLAIKVLHKNTYRTTTVEVTLGAAE